MFESISAKIINKIDILNFYDHFTLISIFKCSNELISEILYWHAIIRPKKLFFGPYFVKDASFFWFRLIIACPYK